MSVGAGFIWLIIGVVWTAGLVFTTPFEELRMSEVTPIFVAGFLLPGASGGYELPASPAYGRRSRRGARIQ